MDKIALQDLIKQKGSLESRMSVLKSKAQDLLKEKKRILDEMKTLGIVISADTDVDKLIKDALLKAKSEIDAAEKRASELTELVQSVSMKGDLE